jgi:hypothetical protein
MYKKLTAGLLLLSMIALPGLSYNAAQAKTPQKTAIKPKVIKTVNTDVTGDKIADNIKLIGLKKYSDSPYYDSIALKITTGSDKKVLISYLDNMSGIEPKMFIGDFSGDKVKDIMINAATGGSGGIVNNRIATIKGGKVNIIFDEDDNQGLALTGKFTDGFKADMNVKNLDKKFTIDLDAFKDSYIKDGIYDADGKLKEEVEPWADGFSLLEPIEYNMDGTLYLRGIQGISGAYHANRISNMESLWKYTGSKWEPINVTYTTSLVFK